MTSDLEDLILSAKKLAHNDNHEEAMKLGDQLIEKYPDKERAWYLKAYLHELKNEYVQAITALSRAIEINSQEPHFFYSRGRYNFALGHNQAAENDFSKGLELCDYYNNDYYKNELFAWRAEVFIRLGKKSEALLDLKRVPEGIKFWTDKLRTKTDLVEDCDRLSSL